MSTIIDARTGAELNEKQYDEMFENALYKKLTVRECHVPDGDIEVELREVKCEKCSAILDKAVWLYSEMRYEDLTCFWCKDTVEISADAFIEETHIKTTGVCNNMCDACKLVCVFNANTLENSL